MSFPALRDSHACLGRKCGHSDADHVSTPELAGPNEEVVWCVVCQQHEVHRHHTWWKFGRGGTAARGLVRNSGPN